MRKRRCKHSRRLWSSFRRANCWTASESIAGLRLVTQEMDDAEPAAVQRLARALIDETGVVALLGCGQRGKGTVVFARSAELSIHVGNLLRDTLRQFGGGGGGRPDFAQGGGVPAEKLTAVLDTASEAVRGTVGG